MQFGFCSSDLRRGVGQSDESMCDVIAATIIFDYNPNRFMKVESAVP